MQKVKTETETYEGYTSEDLLVILSMAEYDPDEGKKAFLEIVTRYREDLVKYCAVKCSATGKDPSDAVDIVWNSFYKLKKNPDGFDMEKANTDDVYQAVLAYLKGIVKKEYHNLYFPSKKTFSGFEFEVDITKSGDQLHTRKVLSDVNEEVISALRRLNWKQREIFLAYLEFAPGKDYLPGPIGEKLREALNLPGESTLRVYNKRAKETLQKLLTDES